MGMITRGSFTGLLWQSTHIMDVMCLERKHSLQSGSFVKERELGIQLNKGLDFQPLSTKLVYIYKS